MSSPDRSAGVGLAPLLLPQPDQGGLVTAHDDAGVGAANEMLAVHRSCIADHH